MQMTILKADCWVIYLTPENDQEERMAEMVSKTKNVAVVWCKYHTQEDK